MHTETDVVIGTAFHAKISFESSKMHLQQISCDFIITLNCISDSLYQIIHPNAMFSNFVKMMNDEQLLMMHNNFEFYRISKMYAQIAARQLNELFSDCIDCIHV